MNSAELWLKVPARHWGRLLEAAKDVVQYQTVEELYRRLQPLRDAIEIVEEGFDG